MDSSLIRQVLILNIKSSHAKGLSKSVSVHIQFSVYFLYTAPSSLAGPPALDSDIAHEYSDYKTLALRNQMSLADFTQFKFSIQFSFQSFSSELSWIFLAMGVFEVCNLVGNEGHNLVWRVLDSKFYKMLLSTLYACIFPYGKIKGTNDSENFFLLSSCCKTLFCP